MSQLTIRQLLEAGSHFGHVTRRWNPKMKQYIYTQRNGVHIIDLAQTVKLAETAYNFIKDTAAQGKTVLFVGTKKQAREMVKQDAIRCGALYLTERWVGGLITNFDSVKKTIKQFNDLLAISGPEAEKGYTKKELSQLAKKRAKMEILIGGIKDLKDLPGALFVLDVKREQAAIAEAKKFGIPIVAICDTNSSPDLIDYPIPANDDALGSIRLLVGYIADAVIEGKKVKKDSNETPKLADRSNI